MASFPTSAHSFTSFANGATTDAAQVTDIYAEVEAIEDGYLNATARLNSSHSTMVALSVTGGSTLTTVQAGNSTVANLSVSSNSTIGGALSVAGNSTIGGALSVAGNSTFDGNLTVSGTLTAGNLSSPSVLVTHDAAQPTASTNWFAVNWNTDVVNGSSMHSTATNSSRITFAGSTGLYQVMASLPLSSVASGAWAVQFRQNDSSIVGGVTMPNGLSDRDNTISVSALVRAADTSDYVTVEVQSITSSGRVYAPSTARSLRFGAYRVST